ncbi:MAG: hypothetical protein DLM65_09930, partial [Candidatus Aeolococcus gillhamiae]
MDVLGRVVSYADAFANSTTSTYDQPGRVIDTVGRDGTRHTDYDAAGRPTAQKLDGATLATPAYDSAGELASVAYANGSALSSLGRDPAGRTTGLGFTQAGGASLVSDSVTRSQAGRVVAQTVDGTPSATFTYDGPGRLTGATVPGHTLTYAFAPTGG